MLNRKMIVGALAGCSVVFGGYADGVVAQMSDMPMSFSAPSQFRQIEQPLGLKLGMTFWGIALVGLELWWFLGSKPKARQAETLRGVQEVTITVDGGYEPSRVVVNLGQPVRLNFLRRDPNSCLEKLLIPNFQIAQDLALNQVTSVELIPQQPGEFPFTCGMNMFRGVLEVRG